MIKLNGIERQIKIKDLIKGGKSLSISQLAQKFSVSEMTIHRDLKKLESEGSVRKTHGGAMPAERMEFEFDFALRRNANRKAKIAIAAYALKLIQPGQRIILDTGTTTLELAYLLKGIKNLTVITPSLAVASVLQFSQGIETILLGGVIRKGSPDLTGVVAESTLDMFSADIAFQGADGIDFDGTVYTADLRIANVDWKIRKRAKKCYILCDSSKIGKTALVKNGFVYEVDALITDKGIGSRYKRVFKKMGANIFDVKL